MDKIIVGGKEFRGDTIPLFGVNLLVIQGEKGMLGCGYLSIPAADKLHHALAVVTGVSSYEEMLAAEVKAVSEIARQRGVAPGMSGAEALLKLNCS